MPWLEPTSVAFSRIGIVSRVPSESGVYAISDGNCCIFVGETWNLKARLLELANVLTDSGTLTVTYELCSEEQRTARKQALTSELLERPESAPPEQQGFSGLLLRTGVSL